jgi:hypothetical protein
MATSFTCFNHKIKSFYVNLNKTLFKTFFKKNFKKRKNNVDFTEKKKQYENAKLLTFIFLISSN